MAREYLSFDNFTLGDTGRHGPMAYHYGRRKMLASYGHFRGLNVMRYPNGAVGPRPPLQNFPLYGLAVSGTIKFIEYAPSYDMMYVVTDDGHVYRRNSWTAGGGTWATVATGLTPLCTTIYGGDLYIGAAGGVYHVTAFGVQAGPFANSPANCVYLAAYREFLIGVVSGSGSIQYTDPGAPTTWPVANAIQIGTGEVIITGLFTQKNSLVTTLANGEWWTTTGFLGADGSAGNDITRRADIGIPYAGLGASVMQSSVWYINGRDAAAFTGAHISSEPLPDPDGLPYRTFPTYVGAGSAAPLSFNGLEPLTGDPDAFLLVGSADDLTTGNQKIFGLARHGTAGWSRHSYPLTISAKNLNLPLVKTVGTATFFFSQQSSNVFVYRWLFREEVPYPWESYTGAGGAASTDPLLVNLDADSGALVSGTFSLPEWWVPDGGSAHVHGVMVDFEYDAEGISQAVADGHAATAVAGFNVTVDALNISKYDTERTSSALAWQPPAEASARAATGFGWTGVRRRELFRVGDQGIGTGFRVNLTNMLGVQVYRIVVVVDLEDEKLF